MKKTYRRFLSGVTVVSMLLMLLAPMQIVGAEVASFPDLEGHWAAGYINKWNSLGLVGGYPDGTFGPSRLMTRAEFITYVNRAFNYTKGAEIDFSDVQSGDWFYGDVAKGMAMGYVTGSEDGTFQPNEPISRLEAAGILYKVLRLAPVDEDHLAEYKDVGTLSDADREMVNSIVAGKYFGGYEDKTLRMQSTISRAEMIVILARATGEIMNVADATFGPEEGTQIINGNATINKAGITLKNTVVKGDLYITEGVGEGDFYLHNVTVEGRTIVAGGGSHSGHVTGTSQLAYVIITYPDGSTHVVFADDASVGAVEFRSPGSVDTSGSSSDHRPSVNISAAVPPGSTITIVGDFEDIVIDAPDVSVDIAEGSSATSVNVSENAVGSSVNVGGQVEQLQTSAPINVSIVSGGSLDSVLIDEKAEGTDIQKDDDVEAPKVEAPAETDWTKNWDDDKPSTPPPSSDPDVPTTIPVREVSVNPTTMTLTVGETSTVTASIIPSNATNKRVNWTSSDTEVATVSNGTVTAVGEGTATITATTVVGGFTASTSVRVFPEYETPVTLGEWVKDRTDPKTWRIDDDTITLETEEEPSNTWWAWQGKKTIIANMGFTHAWMVETEITLTEALLARDGVRASMWLNVVDAKGTTRDWAILQFKIDETTQTEGWQYWVSDDGEWVDIEDIPATEGAHNLAIHYSNGTIILFIDGLEVCNYEIADLEIAGLSSIKEVIFNSYSFGESYEVSWRVPEVRYHKDYPTDTVFVTNETELRTALGGGNTIVIASDLDLASQLKITQPVTVIGVGDVTITPAEDFDEGTYNADKHLISVDYVDGLVKLENLSVAGSIRTGINIVESTNVVLNDVTVSGSTAAGVVVNSSTVTANNLNTVDNGWGAVNVDIGSAQAASTSFALAGIGLLEENTQIWSDGTYSTDVLTVTVDADGYSEYLREDGVTIWTDRALDSVATITRNGQTTVYATIQAAIAAASGGDTVLVAAGEYDEIVSVTGKSVTLRGANQEGTKVKAISASPGAENTLVVQNLTVYGNNASGQSYAGIFIANGGVTVDSCIIQPADGTDATKYGIETQYNNAANITVKDCNISGYKGCYFNPTTGSLSLINNNFNGVGPSVETFDETTILGNVNMAIGLFIGYGYLDDEFEDVLENLDEGIIVLATALHNDNPGAVVKLSTNSENGTTWGGFLTAVEDGELVITDRY